MYTLDICNDVTPSSPVTPLYHSHPTFPDLINHPPPTLKNRSKFITLAGFFHKLSNLRLSTSHLGIPVVKWMLLSLVLHTPLVRKVINWVSQTETVKRANQSSERIKMPKGLKHGKARAGKLTIIIGTMSYCLVPRGGGGGEENIWCKINAIMRKIWHLT